VKGAELQLPPVFVQALGNLIQKLAGNPSLLQTLSPKLPADGPNIDGVSGKKHGRLIGSFGNAEFGPGTQRTFRPLFTGKLLGLSIPGEGDPGTLTQRGLSGLLGSVILLPAVMTRLPTNLFQNLEQALSKFLQFFFGIKC